MKRIMALLLLAPLVAGVPLSGGSGGGARSQAGMAHAATSPQAGQDREVEAAQPGGRVVIKGRDGKVTGVERAPATQDAPGDAKGNGPEPDDAAPRPDEAGPEPEAGPDQ